MILPPLISQPIDLATLFTRALISPPQTKHFATFYNFVRSFGFMLILMLFKNSNIYMLLLTQYLENGLWFLTVCTIWYAEQIPVNVWLLTTPYIFNFNVM